MLAKTSLLRRGILLMAISVLLALIVAVPKAASGQSPDPNQNTIAGDENTSQDQDIKVKTRNLYLGADLDPAVAAAVTGDLTKILEANSAAWQQVKETNFPERAEALADEIKQSKPLLVGLQEAQLWRTGPADSAPGTLPNATDVKFDYLDILLDELNNDEQGPKYTPVVVNQNYDVESVADTDIDNGIYPEGDPEDLKDIRITDRDVILARTDLPQSELKLSKVQQANFINYPKVPIGNTGQTIDLKHGWASVDAETGGKKFRFINTHLEPESDNPAVNDIQVAQANEILDGPAKTHLPVILAGDFNSRADGTGTLTYGNLIGAGFKDAWSVTHPEEPGYTCCQTPDLKQANALDQRIDLVLFRQGAGKGEGLRALEADIVGESPSDRTTPHKLWPSDHAGVVATLRWQDG